MKRELPPYCYWRRRKSGAHVRFERAGVSVRIEAAPGAAEFHAEYAKLLRGVAPVPKGKTFRALIAHYRRSGKFAKLAPRTKSDYDKVLAFIEERLGDLPPAKLQKHHVVRFRDDNARTVRFANYVVQMLRILMAHAWEIGWRNDNPATGVAMLKSTAEPRQPWPADKVAAFRSTATGRALLIFELCLGTGQRIGDVLRMRWDHLEAGGVHVRQGKTKRALWVPFTPALQAALDATPRRGLTILCDDVGRCLRYPQARHAVATVRAQIGAEDYGLHALRHTAAHELAAAGCTDELIMAITGHTSRAMVARYAGPVRQRSSATKAQGERK